MKKSCVLNKVKNTAPVVALAFLASCTMYDTFDENLIPIANAENDAPLSSSVETFQSSSGEVAASSSSENKMSSSSETSSAECGAKIEDVRDGQKYETTLIGTQCWLAENMRYEIKSASKCYEDKVENCEAYGRLYSFGGAQGACPEGWRLPVEEDFLSLAQNYGVNTNNEAYFIKSIEGWIDHAGINKDGFNALPAGKFGDDRKYSSMNTWTGFWTSVADGEDEGVHAYLRDEDNDLYMGSTEVENFLSVRCIK